MESIARWPLRATGLDDAPLRGLPGSTSFAELYHLLRDPRAFFHDRFERYGRVFKSRLVYPVVFAVGDEANRSMLVTRRHDVAFGAGYAATNVEKIFAGSMMLQDGEDHRRTRDLLSPAVGTLAIKESANAVRTVWSHAADRIGERGGGDCYEMAERGTFDAAANVLTGLSLGAETDSFRPHFRGLIDGVMAPTKLRIPLGRLDRALKSREALFDLLRPRVEAARRVEPVALLGKLAHHRDENGKPIATDDIIGHILLLFWAGYDTTASSAAWILHELAYRADWQLRLREELRAGGDITSNGECPQLNNFLFEIERMYPSALFFPRIALADLEIGGLTIPKRSTVFYSPYMSHRDPEAFENPNVFDPDRFSAARGASRAVATKLVGFGGGPRICLGKSFAKLQLKIMIKTILERFHLEPDPNARPSVLALPIHHPSHSLIRARSLH